jgi:hypothetical protein
MKQYRGCSRLYYALETDDGQGNVTFGSPKVLAPVKSVSRDISSDNEPVYADNVVQQRTYGATSITRTFDTTRIAQEVIADLLGQTAITIGEGQTSFKAYANEADGSSRPYFAIGYALHDGDIDNPCEVVWAYHCQCNSISKTSNTIDDGTGSEGQSIEIVNVAPKKAFTTTNKRNLDFNMPINDNNKTLIDTFFAQVITPDNASTYLVVSQSASSNVE